MATLEFSSRKAWKSRVRLKLVMPRALQACQARWSWGGVREIEQGLARSVPFMRGLPRRRRKAGASGVGGSCPAAGGEGGGSGMPKPSDVVEMVEALVDESQSEFDEFFCGQAVVVGGRAEGLELPEAGTGEGWDRAGARSAKAGGRGRWSRNHSSSNPAGVLRPMLN